MGGVRFRFVHHVAHVALGAFFLILGSYGTFGYALTSGAPMSDTSALTAQIHASPAVIAAVPSVTPPPVAATSSPVASKPKVLGASTSGGAGFGIAANLAALSSSELSTRLAGMKQLGVGWVRYDLEWSNVEYNGSGQYDWSNYDRVVAAVNAHGLRSLVIIDYTPSWARRSDCADTAMCAPADPAAYARFAAVAAARYAPQGIHYWEIWNEPNNADYFKPAADASEYTAMLRASYASIKAVDGRATVLSGGLSPAATGGGYVSPVDFTNGMYAAGAEGSFDALADHPYSWPYSPGWYNPGGAWGEMAAIRAIMVAHGDGNKKIWITEFGAPTGGPGSQASNGYSTAEGGADHVTESLEARILSDAVTIENATSYIGPFFWYTYEDSGTSSATVENFFGLLRTDGSTKPAYAAFQSLINRY